MFKKLFIFATGCFLATASAHAAGVEIDFEDYTVGQFANPPQGGWSGGIDPNLTNDDTTIVDAVNHTPLGSKSWHASTFYGSPGSGTPFSPSLDLLENTGPGTTFTAELWFLAGDSSGDNSKINIYLGSFDGGDRTGFNVELVNGTGGLIAQTMLFDPLQPNADLGLGTANGMAGMYNEVFSEGLDRSAWHRLNIVAKFNSDPADDIYKYTVDGVDPGFVGRSWPNEWRCALGYEMVWGDQLKFADSTNSTPHNGFYFDDISYSSAETHDGGDHSCAVPEPSSFAMFGLGLIAVYGGWRKRRKLTLNR